MDLKRLSIIGCTLAIACGETTTRRPSNPPPNNMMTAQLTGITISPAAPMVEKGKTVPLTAMAQFDDGSQREVTATAQWASENMTVATVDMLGTVRGLEEGTSIISATQGTLTASVTVTVTGAGVASLTITPATADIAVGATVTFTVRAELDDGTQQDVTNAVTWSSSDPSVALINNGTATGVAAGSTSITATEPASGQTISAQVTVTAPPLIGIEIQPNSPRIPLGATQQFTAMGRFADGVVSDVTARVQWTSSSTAVADINASGLATTRFIGFTTITAVDSTSGVNGVATLTVTTPALMTIEVAPMAASGGVGSTQRFSATGTYSDQTTRDLTGSVDWMSTDTNIVRVAAGGLATAVTVGTATISAVHPSSGVSSADSGQNAVYEVTPPTLVSIAVLPLNASIALGDTQQFTATGIFSDQSNQDLTSQVVWVSTDPTIARVDSSTGSPGLATSVSPGMVTISARDPMSGISSDDNMRSASLTVEPPDIVALEVVPGGAAVTVGAMQAFRAMATYTDGSTGDATAAVNWSSSSTRIVTVNSMGVATGRAVGMARIRALDPMTQVSSDDTDQSAAVNVSAAPLVSIAVTPISATLPVAASGQRFTATGTYGDNSTQDISGSVTWRSSNPGVVMMNGALATPVATGMATISAEEPLAGISSDTTNGSATLTVSAAQITSIAVNPPTVSLNVNQTQQFSAVATFDDNSSHELQSGLQWQSSNAAVATVSNTPPMAGLVTAAGPGMADISVTHQPSGVMSTIGGQVSVQSALFFENFEDGNFNGWMTGTGNYSVREVTNIGANNTTRSLRMVGGSGHYNGINHSLPGIQATEISLYVRTINTTASDGYFVIGDQVSSSSQGIIFFHFGGGGVMYCYDGSRRQGETNYVANRWYLLEFRNFNWQARTFDFYVDGVQRATSVRFRSGATTLRSVHLYNFGSSTAWWDEIRIN